MRRRNLRTQEHGATMVEMSIAGTALCLTIFGVIEFGRLLLVQNGLADAARRGARYAVLNSDKAADIVTKVQNITVFGVTDPAADAKPLVNGLTTDKVSVTYSSDFGVHQGAATVSITGYTFSFAVPLIGATIGLGKYKTTLTGEAAGNIPPPI